MKKTNKTFKRFAAITSASLLAACAVAPVAFNAFAAPSTIEIINADEATHTYEAYQIFDGDISGEGTSKVLINIEWGANVDATKLLDNPDYDAIKNPNVPQKIDIYQALMYANEDYIKGYNYSIPVEQTDLQTAYDAWVAGNELEDDSVNAYYAALKEADENDVNLKKFKATPVPYDTAEAIADVLAKYGNKSDEAYQFADIVAKYLKGDGTASHKVTADEAVDKDEANSVPGGKYAAYEKDDIIIPNLDDGYYLIQDTTSSPGSTVSGENSGAKTRFILKVTDDTTQPINAKASAPTVMKKVQEDSLTAEKTGTVNFAGNKNYNPGTGYNDVADYAIGDAVPFKLYGTMPSTLDDYDHYYYKFTDNLGSQFNQPASLKIKIGEVEELVFNWMNVENGSGTGEWKYVTTDESNGNCSVTFNNGKLEITFKDIKAYEDTTDPENVETVTKDTVVTVEYNAVLNESAKIGYEGQLNKVDITYSNNPNEEYKPWNEDGSSSNDEVEDTGTTKEDGVIVFTYGFDINKYENGDFADKLADAKFAVYYLDESDNKVYIKTDDNNCYAGDLETAPTKETEVKNENGVWKSSEDKDINIVIKGLDVGTYYIEEIAAPVGYNPLTEPVKVVVASTYTKTNTETGENEIIDIYTQNWTYNEKANFVYTYAGESDTTGTKTPDKYTALDSITLAYGSDPAFKIADAEQKAEGETPWAELEDLGTVNIENKKGTALPGTGGIGTTIFYLGGGAMAAIGGIYLISKRRMRKSEE